MFSLDLVHKVKGPMGAHSPHFTVTEKLSPQVYPLAGIALDFFGVDFE